MIRKLHQLEIDHRSTRTNFLCFSPSPELEPVAMSTEAFLRRRKLRRRSTIQCGRETRGNLFIVPIVGNDEIPIPPPFKRRRSNPQPLHLLLLLLRLRLRLLLSVHSSLFLPRWHPLQGCMAAIKRNATGPARATATAGPSGSIVAG